MNMSQTELTPTAVAARVAYHHDARALEPSAQFIPATGTCLSRPLCQCIEEGLLIVPIGNDDHQIFEEHAAHSRSRLKPEVVSAAIGRDGHAATLAQLFKCPKRPDFGGVVTLFPSTGSGLGSRNNCCRFTA